MNFITDVTPYSSSMPDIFYAESEKHERFKLKVNDIKITNKAIKIFFDPIAVNSSLNINGLVHVSVNEGAEFTYKLKDNITLFVDDTIALSLTCLL